MVQTPPRVTVVVPTRGSAPSSSRDRGTNPGFGTLLESLSWCQPRGVTTRVVTRGRRRTVRVVLPIPHSCRYCGINPGFDFLLVSLTWFKPGERLSVATPWCNDSCRNSRRGAGQYASFLRCMLWGSTPWCDHSCRNSRTPPDSTRCSCVVSVLWSAPSSSRYRGSNRSSSHCRGANPGFGTLLESLSWCQPRGVTTRVVIRGRTPPNRFNKMKGRRFI